MIMAYVLCSVTLLLDGALFGIALGMPQRVNALPMLAVGHAASCAAFALALWRLLPAPLRRQRWKFTSWMFIVAFLVPILGMAGILLLATSALKHRRQPRMRPARTDATGNIPGGTGEETAWHAGIPGRDLSGILRHASKTAARATALIHTLTLEDERALPLLRIALRDKDDDIRLLSYALLSRKEKQLEQCIEQHRTTLAQASAGQAFRLHRALAYEFWELAYRAVPMPGQPSPFAMQAGEHVAAALALRPQDAGLCLLHGRILLQAMQLDAARAAFEEAARLGLRRQAASYLDEIAFRSCRPSVAGAYAQRAARGLQAPAPSTGLLAEMPA